VVTFADASHGFIVTAPDRFSLGMGTVLRTDDGGRSWSAVGTTDALGANVATQPGGSTLWAGANAWAGGIGPWLLQVSRDGGASWTTIDLPGLAGARSPETYLLGPPVFLNAYDGVVVVVDGDSPALLHFFRTADGGRSWTAATPVPAASLGRPAILSVDHWLASEAAGGSLVETVDAGANWRQIQPRGIADPILWLGFADALHGAALVQIGDTPVPPKFFLTSDGGHRWSPADLGPP
jgi:photosystem II stability/assembly factor-like uncharacterized protein